MNRRLWLRGAGALAAAQGAVGVGGLAACAPLRPAPPALLAEPGALGGTSGCRLVVPFEPGGISTLLAEALRADARDAGCEVLHLPGHTNMRAAVHLLRHSPADGNTLLVCGPTIFTLGPALNPFLSIDPQRDFSLVAPLAVGPMVLVSARSAGYEHLGDLAAAPAPKRCAVSGLGAPSHFVAAHIDAQIGPLGDAHNTEGDLPGIEGVLAGRFHSAVVSLGSCGDHLDGRLRFLATSGAEPLDWPDGRRTPTVNALSLAAGRPGFVFENWLALAVPAKTPPAILQRLRAHYADTALAPAMTALLRRMGHRPLRLGLPALQAEIERYREDWTAFVLEHRLDRALGLRLD